MHPLPREKIASVFLLAAVASLTFFAECHTPTVDSSWPKSKPTVDGYCADWEGLVNYSLCDQFGIGVANDDRYLYLRLSAEDRRTMMQLLRCGLTISFQTSAPKLGFFALRFPVGGNRLPREPRNSPDGQIDTALLSEQIDAVARQAQILGPRKHDTLFLQASILETYGILARMYPSFQYLIYEARIPLYDDSAANHAINPGKDDLITISFEIPAPQPSEQHRGGEGGEMSGRGGGGYHGGSMIGHGNAMGGSFGVPAEPIEAKMVVKLAGKR